MANTDPREPEVVGLSYYVRILRQWWLAVLLVPILAAAYTYWLQSRQVSTYTATARVMIVPATNEPNDVQTARLQTATYSELVATPFVLERVIEQLQVPLEVADLQSMVDATIVPDTPLIDISVEATDPEAAAALANRTAEVFVTWFDELQGLNTPQSSQSLELIYSDYRNAIEKNIVDLAALLKKPNPTAAETQQITRLREQLIQQQAQYDDLQKLDITNAVGPQSQLLITDPAQLPTEDNSSGQVRYVILAFVVGLVLAMAAVIAYERVMKWVRRPEDLYRTAGVPVLGVVPRLRGKAINESWMLPQSPAGEALRALRTTVQLATKEPAAYVLVVTSPASHNGKSVVAANLAALMAKTGKRVVLLDGDLRNPQQHKLFSKANSAGLARSLTHFSAEIQTLLTETPLAGLYLLPAESAAESTIELLASDRLERRIAELRQLADVIVIDAPPMTSFSDALLLATQADYGVLVVDAGHTSTNEVKSALAGLQQSGVNFLGAVLYGGSVGRYGSAFQAVAGAAEPSTKEQSFT